jgi:hypothetical protein
MAWRSPTGKEIVATAELVHGTCGITINDDGTFDYDGTGTDVDWDSQVQRQLDGQRLFVDEDGDIWRENQIDKNAPDDEDDDV